MSGRGGGIAGWLGDALRGAHALIFWNWKKTRFRARGAKGRAPCQNESDEPKLGLVRCDVVMQWRQPARFRPVCPLLVSTPDGWRCSVPSAQVRPFWGRAAAFTGGAGLAVFLAVTLGVFAFFRWGNGLPLRWTDVAWPGHWSRIRTLQAKGFDPAGLQTDLQFKFALPLSGIITVLLGLPLALRGSRRAGSAQHIGTGLGICFLYWLMQALTVSAGHAGTLPPVVAAWSANAVFLLVGTLLALRS